MKMLKKTVAAFIPALFLLGGLVFASCQGKNGVTAPVPREKSATIALAADWASINAFVNIGASYKTFVQSLLFDRLVTLKNDGEFAPRLLSEWQTSADGMILTGKLFEKATWHDGTPVTAEDIVFSFNLYTHPQIPHNTIFNLVKGVDAKGSQIPGEEFGVKAIDEKTVEFHLNRPTQYITFFSLTDSLFILPKHLLKNADLSLIQQNSFFDNPVGSGPFIFASQIPGTELNLRANKEFHLGTPDIERLTARVVPNNNVLPGLLSGEIDITAGSGLSALPYSDFVQAQGEENIVTQAVDLFFGSQFAIFNTTQPALRDERIRRGIESAINKQAIVDNLLKGYGTAAYSPISRLSPYYYQDLAINDYNPERAKRLLDEARFDYSRSLRLLVPSGNADREQSAVVIQQDLAAVGIKVELYPIDFATEMAILQGGTQDFDFALLGRMSSINPSLFKNFFGVSASANFARLPDDEILDLFTAGEFARNDAEARNFFNQAQQRLQDRAPFIFLYNEKPLVGYTKRLHNIDLAAYYLSDTIWEWKVD